MSLLPAIRHWQQTWPAAEAVEIDGWLLQATDGFTKRANAALRLSPEASIDVVEDFYRSRWLRPSVVDYASLADPLPQRLIGHQWHALPFDPVLTMPLTRLPGDDRPALSEPEVSATPTDRWFSGWFASGRTDSAAARTLVIGSPGQRFAIIDDGDAWQPVAVGRVGLVGEWAGVNCMWTRPDQRGHGHAMAILRSLARAAKDQGAEHLQLSVDHAHPIAQRLYCRAGFELTDRYRYLFAPEPATGPRSKGPHVDRATR